MQWEGTTLEGGGIWRGTITYHHISDQDNQSWGTHFNSERRRTKQNYIWHSSSPLFNDIWWKIPYFCTTKSLGYFAKHLTIFVPGLANLNKNFSSKPERGESSFLWKSRNCEWLGWLRWGKDQLRNCSTSWEPRSWPMRENFAASYTSLVRFYRRGFSKYCNMRSTVRIVTQLDDLLHTETLALIIINATV